LVDGQLVGGVDLGKEVSVKISKDVHTLQVKFGNNLSDMLTIPPGDNEYTYSVELKVHVLYSEVILSEIGYVPPGGELVKKV